MIDRKRLFNIPQINHSAGEIASMDDNQFAAYVQLLAKFVEIVPKQEESLKIAIENLDYDSNMQCLVTIWNMLTKICADDLAGSCLKQIEELKKMANEKSEARAKSTREMTMFLTALSTLSIDIQMGLYQWPPNQPEQTESTREQLAGKSTTQVQEKIILAVDDAFFFLTTLRRCLKNLPYKLACVLSGDAALRFLQHHNPSLFILDIEMPEMNGYELAQKIRQGGHQAPIIFLTGNATRQNVRKAIEAGAADFIVKPINDRFALEVVNKYI